MIEKKPQRPAFHEHLIACPSCDWLHQKDALNPRERARCVRCRTVMYTFLPGSLDQTLAATIGSIVLLIAGLFPPFLSLSRSGINSNITLLDTAWALVFSEIALLGIFVTLLIILIPLLRLSLMAYVLLFLKFGGLATMGVKRAFRLALLLEPWSMVDVFLIGVVVSLIKISELAVLDIGLAFFAWLGLIFSTVLISLTLSKDTLWHRISQQ